MLLPSLLYYPRDPTVLCAPHQAPQLLAAHIVRMGGAALFAVQCPPLPPSAGMGISHLVPCLLREICVLLLATPQYVQQWWHRAATDKPCWTSECPVWLLEERQAWPAPQESTSPTPWPSPCSLQCQGRETTLDFLLEACFCTWEKKKINGAKHLFF